MPPTYFPLRWESTGEQWWYASPLDWAAANGHYDLVRELLRIDSNHLIKLTSLRRIRRLETVWDDEEQFNDVAKCRCQVAWKLFHECESRGSKNSLVRAGYGGWLMYTAASAGDLGFVQVLLEKHPLLVFGEGEYGVTDIIYAAARSKNSKVFKLIFDFAVSPRFHNGKDGVLEEQIGDTPSLYKWEMTNRAVHAAARGGNVKILHKLVSNCSDVLAYRDTQGSTILHSAASRGQVEVIEYLTTTFAIINSTDHQGNTALHVASYSGQLAAVRSLIISFPSLTSSTNNAGETFLHKAVSGFQTAAFRRMDQQIELMKQLVRGTDFHIRDVVNIKKNDGKTALHVAVIGNSPLELVQLLMTAESIDVNVYDANGMTPLDYLKSRPASASSDILIRQLLSAGAIFSCQDITATRALASQLKMHGSSSSNPGTLFRISDAEIFLYTGIENTSDASVYQGSAGLSSSSSEINARNSTCENGRRTSSVNSAAARLTRAFLWPKGKDKKSRHSKSSNEESPIEQYRIPNDTGETPSPLRERFNSKPSSSLPNNKRTLSVRSNQTSPSPKRFASGTVLAVTKSTSHDTVRGRSPSNSLSRSSFSSTNSLDKQKGMR